ncbi:MAG: peptide chain release factor-like protein [Planctomycetota bacterium]|nr:MAG: peptide chain release factor-like protein [Planctomycetota bacterium]
MAQVSQPDTKPDAPATHPACWPAERLLAACTVQRTRRSGPGGQHRNKVATAVVITHVPTGVRAEASERRSQAENSSRAVFRLRIELALAIRGAAADVPSDLWRSRACRGHFALNAAHGDFPAILAEALDMLAACGWSPGAAAQRLGVTTSQLVKLLKLQPRAFALMNIERKKSGSQPLR